MNPTTPTTGRSSPPKPKPRPRPGQTLAEFSLTLPLLLLLLFGIIEFGRIFQAWVTLQNAARAAARVAITGEYDTTMFSNLDNPWSPGVSGYAGDGVPCKYPPYDPSPYSTFRNHWGMDCDPTSDDDQWLRKDMLRLIAINKAAQVGAAGLALGSDPNTGQVWMDIPGTEPLLDGKATGTAIDNITGVNAGIGAQHYAETLDGGDTSKYDHEKPMISASNQEASLLYLSENQRAWFHVFICSTRPSLAGEQDNKGNIISRYAEDPDFQATIGGTQHQKFARCMVNEGGGAAGDTIDGNPVSTTQTDQWGSDQYDPGGPGDYVDIIVYFNHPLITPLGLGNTSFIQMQARRRAVNESFRAAKAINLTNTKFIKQPTPSPTNTFTPTPSPTNTDTPSNTPTNTNTPTSTYTYTPSDTSTPTNTNTPTNTSTPTATATNTATKTYTPTNTATRTNTPTNTVSPTPTLTFTRPPNTGTITRLLWNNVYKSDGVTPCNTVACLTNFARFSNSQPNFGSPNFCQTVPKMQTPWNTGVTEYGEILVGYLVPPDTANYTFYLSSSAQSEFDLWPDASGTGLPMMSFSYTGGISQVTGNPNWGSKRAQSPAIMLQANQRYFVIAYHKYSDPNANQGLADDFAVGWQGGSITTTSIIDGQYLQPETLNSCVGPTVTPTPSNTPTATNTRTSTTTLTPSQTFTPSITPTRTNTATHTATPTNTNTPLPSNTPTNTKTPTNTFTPSNTPPATNTPTNTNTPTRTFTPTITNTPSNTPTKTPSNTPTNTFTPTATYTPSKTNTPTNTPTYTPTNTPTPSNTPTPTKTPKPTFCDPQTHICS